MGFSRRILDGYARIGMLLVRVVIGIGILIVLAALITLPLWLLAGIARPAYNAIVLLALLATVVYLLWRRRTTQQSTSGRVLSLVAAILGPAIVIGALAVGSLPTVVFGILASTLPFAWSLGSRR